MFDDNSSRLQKIEAYSQVTEIPDWMFDETVAGYKNTGLILRLQKYPLDVWWNSGRLQKYEAYSQVTEIPVWCLMKQWPVTKIRGLFSGYRNTRLDVWWNSGRLQKYEAYSQVTEIPDWMFDETVAGYKKSRLILRLQKYPIGCLMKQWPVTITYKSYSLVTEIPDLMLWR